MANQYAATSPIINRHSEISCCVHLLATALGLSLLGSCGGLLVASTLVSFPSRVRTRLVPWLVSYAVGALLGVALLDILPEALTLLAPQAVFGTLLAGILLFFALEKLVLLRHCHTDECEVHGAPTTVASCKSCALTLSPACRLAGKLKAN